ncbi:MAG: triple tyrosine motif-containing protein, partial [Flavobacteriales bacterium]
KVAITGLQVFGRDVIYDSSITAKQLITLTHSDYNFSIEFVGLSYVHPNKNTYAYKMEGFDAGWNHAGNRRFATYTNLPPGSYVFKVKAANNDGIWSGRPASIRVEILPAFWQTLWFRGLLIMFMLLSAYFIHRIRVRNMQQQNRRLEKMVTKRTAEVVSQRDEIKKKNMLIEESFKEIQDSIRYAKRIQLAILPPDQYVEKLLPDSFLLYKPKDIVSGDFYWVAEWDGRVFFAAVDCTGHGVPGAFMSIVGNNQLNNAVNVRNATSPSEILDALNEGVSGTLRQKDAHPDVKDGMDLALCAIDRKSMRLEFAGAYNPLYIIRKGIANQKLRIAGNYRFFEDDLLEVKADKVPIGGSESGSKFTNFEFELQQGDAIYIFSDGYADQFGGPLGKKYKYKTLKKKLLEIHEKPMQEQKQLLADEFGAWKGEEEQVDDVCLIGVRA